MIIFKDCMFLNQGFSFDGKKLNCINFSKEKVVISIMAAFVILSIPLISIC